MTARRITIAEIRQACAAHFGVTVADILGPSRKRVHFVPRSIAVYLAREITGKSQNVIGREFGNRDPRTVNHSIKCVKACPAKTDAANQIHEGLFA